MTVHLRRVGGSLMFAVPPAAVAELNLQEGASADAVVDGGNLVLKPLKRPRYTLDELLAQCDPTAPRSAEDQAWLDDAPVGEELI
jgi:antitoxin ChpS